jgi:hypothetical protein
MAGDVLADARIGRVVSAVGIWSPCRIRGCERRRAPAPRSGHALDCRRQSGAEERGFAESDGALETQWLAAPKNFAALADLSGQWIDLVHGRRPPRGIVLDMDLSVSPTHGERVEVLRAALRRQRVELALLSRRDNTGFASREKSRDSNPSAIIV